MWKQWYPSKRHEIILSDRWVWPERTFRFNGGGYLYGARPYQEFAIGPLRFRHYVG